MISLYGSLAKKFKKQYKAGTRLRIKVNSIAEMIRAMEANFPGFKRLIRKKGHYHIVRGTDMVKGRSVVENEIEMNFQETDWHILPVAAGGKDGIVQTIIGAALIVAGAALNFFVPGNPIGMHLIQSGAVMMIGGVAQMLSPAPGGDLNREKPSENPSYLFNGPVNTVEPGTTIGVGYGEFFVGTITVSGGIKVENI